MNALVKFLDGLFAEVSQAAVRAVLKHQNGQAPQKTGLLGRKLDMRCRAARCFQKSKGPRYRFMCERHLRELTVQQQREAVRRYRED
jgi:hypothetical protein